MYILTTIQKNYLDIMLSNEQYIHDYILPVTQRYLKAIIDSNTYIESDRIFLNTSLIPHYEKYKKAGL